MDHLSAILARKRLEIDRRRRRPARVVDDGLDRAPSALSALYRGPDDRIRVIGEIKRRSPSEGVLRERRAGDVASIARSYERAGAAAISVLADGPGFGGSVLDVRRAARAVSCPVLFKEFVLDPIQLPFARAAGASLVLLLVRALDGPRLASMVRAVRDHGMEPVVEVADRTELDLALATDARIVGVNARDLRSFTVDADAAAAVLREVPKGRIAVYMSGVSRSEQLIAVASGRADAVLIGSTLMRGDDPGARLAALLEGAAGAIGRSR
jgi:indole-3-glycerol phosphate synthase